jgi:hypothetical protein
MPRNCLPALLLAIGLLLEIPSKGQKVEFFKDITFDSSYTVIGIGQGYAKSVDSFPRFWFILEDPAEMNKLKKDWVFSRQVGYQLSYQIFDVFVIKDKRLAASTGIIYPDQRIINTGNGHWYPFDTADLVRLHAAHPLKYHTEKKTFVTWREYAAYGNSLLNDPKLLFFFEPSRNFEGSFDIIASRSPDPSSPIFVLRDVSKELGMITARANFQAGHDEKDSFNIAHRDKVKIEVHGSRTLYDQYNFEGREKGPWRPQPIDIRLFWRD